IGLVPWRHSRSVVPPLRSGPDSRQAVAGDVRLRAAGMNWSSTLLIARRSAGETYLLCLTSCARGAFFGGAALGVLPPWTSARTAARVPTIANAIPRRMKRRRARGDEGRTRMQREYQQKRGCSGGARAQLLALRRPDPPTGRRPRRARPPGQ